MTPTDLTLVVMAAGIGSRFGGAKQLAEVGPGGEAILDYTIVDARRAGFGRVVLIVRTDLVDLVRAHLARHHGPELRYELVLQDRFGPRREKPWGTGHAVLAAESAAPGPFAVVNADDFYGRSALEQLARALQADHVATRHHLVAYRLDQTLSEEGTVSRGVCDVGSDGTLRGIEEHLRLVRSGDGRIRSEGVDAALPPDTLVSMNLWGLRPSIFGELRAGWETFVAVAAEDPKAEFLLPAVIDGAVAAGRAEVAVHATDSAWMGITYPGDLDAARRRIAELVAAGVY